MLESKRVRRWWPALAGGAALGAAAVFGFSGYATPLFAEDGKPVEKKPADAKPNFKPEDVHVGAPPELEALRKAVETAGKKGENVDEIRKQLEALEKALTGRAWVKPQVMPEVVRPGQPPRAVPAFPGFPQAIPALPDVGGLDGEAIRKMQEMMRRAQEMRINPQDPEAMRKMMEEQQRLMRDALGGLGGRIAGVPGIAIGGRNIQRIGDGRLGVRLESVPLVVADQLGLPAGRGLVVADVVPGSAAEKAGVKPSDIIVEFAGQPVTDDHHEMVKRVNDAKTGEKIDVTVLRKGKKETLQVELPDMNRRDLGRRADVVPGGFPLQRGNAVRISVNNGQFELQSDGDDGSYGLKGEMADGKPVISEITVTVGDKSTKYESVDQVPAEHREKVEGLLSRINGGRRQPKID